MKQFAKILIESAVTTIGSYTGMAVGFLIWCGAIAYRKNS